MRLKLLQKEEFKKPAEVTDDLVGNKIAYKITNVSRGSPQFGHDYKLVNMIKKYLKKDAFSEERQKIIDDLRLI